MITLLVLFAIILTIIHVSEKGDTPLWASAIIAFLCTLLLWGGWAVISTVASFFEGTVNMSGWENFLVVGGAWFWTFLVLLIIVECCWTYTDVPGWQFGNGVLILGFLLALQFCSDAKPFTWVYNHPPVVFMLIVGWLLIALAWSMLYWWVRAQLAKSEYKESENRYLSEQGKSNPSDLSDGAKDKLRYLKKNLEKRMNFWENLGRITAWGLYWPVSITSFLFGDLLTKVCRAFVVRCSAIYEGISKGALAEIGKGL